ncbi:MAG: ATP-binding cassette domain-containing protein [Deltaproteobacteria bacterium]|nr:ATP-binding cassette domain-containing protein [Deltaproteobacteria bacterium]
MADSVLDLSEIHLRRGPLTLLSNVNWKIEKGQHWALLGPNGAGKTLILRIVTGYIWPTDGQVTVLGHRLGRYDLRKLRTKIGWVSQALSDLMPGHTSVLETIVSGYFASLGLYAKPDQNVTQKAQLLAEEFGLAEMTARPFAHLSSGERQRALLARAAVADPELLILDEPMSNLDMGGRELFLDLLTKLASSPKAPTIILTTHNILEIAPFITSALVIRKGEVMAAGPLDQTLTSSCLTRAFDLDLTVEKTNGGRYVAYSNKI